MSLYKVCHVSDLDPATAMAVEVPGKIHKQKIAIVRDEGGNWHAIDDTCPHADVSLAEGDVEGCTIECWGHGAKVDLRTGEGTIPITSPVTVYEVQICNDEVFIDYHHEA